MQAKLLEYVPENWTEPHGVKHIDKIKISEECAEFQKIYQFLGSPTTITIENIYRIQDLFSYGQFLIRKELLAANNTSLYYKVRRYCVVKRKDQEAAVKYNLDPRRCGQTLLSFTTKPKFPTDSVVFIVTVLTTNPDSTVTPTYYTEFYIEYVVEYILNDVID